jgi:hypothetical protein
MGSGVPFSAVSLRTNEAAPSVVTIPNRVAGVPPARVEGVSPSVASSSSSSSSAAAAAEEEEAKEETRNEGETPSARADRMSATQAGGPARDTF